MGAPLLRILADAQVECLQGSGCSTGLPTVNATQGNLGIIMSIVFGVIGAVAIIVIVIAGLNMSMAEGDAAKVARARQAVIFALVGLVIAISAETIIAFTVKSI